MQDVIISGCGPTGAVLAAELRLHGVRVLVLEKETEPKSFVRIVGLHIRSIELMAMRGLLDRILEHGRKRPAGGFFAAIDKPVPKGLDSAHAYLLGIPQPVIERLLEEHAIALGARVRRGRAVTALQQDGEGVTVELAGGERLRARHLVGCDGARSTVRKLLGVGFPGEPSRNERLMGEMKADAPQEEIAARMAEIGDRRFWLRPFGEGVYSVVVPAVDAGDRAGNWPRRSAAGPRTACWTPTRPNAARSPPTSWTTRAPRRSCRPPERARRPCAGCSPN